MNIMVLRCEIQHKLKCSLFLFCFNLELHELRIFPELQDIIQLKTKKKLSGLHIMESSRFSGITSKFTTKKSVKNAFSI